MMNTLLRKAIVVLACISLFAGCGAANAIGNARASLDRVKAAGAETKAPFEYSMADEYLKRADHEAAEGDTRAARSFAEKSSEYSERAGRIAGGGAK